MFVPMWIIWSTGTLAAIGAVWLIKLSPEIFGGIIELIGDILS